MIELINHHYRIIRTLGKGGMAHVYLAEDENLARLTDVPEVVTLLDYGIHNTEPFLVMSYMPGGTLKEKMGTPMAIAKALH